MMKRTPQKRRRAELVNTRIEVPTVTHEIADESARQTRASRSAQLATAGRPRGGNGANHARHHVARKSQS
jgi:hypothetical protein